MHDVFFAVIFMTLVFGLAAGILWLVDKWNLPRGASQEERTEIVEERTGRWGARWRNAFIVMAAISIPVNLAGLITKTEPFFPTVIWIIAAAFLLLSAWSTFHGNEDE